MVGLDLGHAARRGAAGVEYRQLDVTDAAGWAALAADLSPARRVARAGRQRRHHLAGPAAPSSTRPTWRGCSEVNVTGTLLGIQALTPLMPAGASIVVVGSVAALTGHYPVAYTAWKWALRGLAKAACLELGPRGHPGQHDPPRLHRDADDRLGGTGVPRRQRRRDPAGPHRHGRRGRPARRRSCSATTPRSSPAPRSPSTAA